MSDVEEKQEANQQLTHEDKVALLFGEGTTAGVLKQTVTGGANPFGVATTGNRADKDFVPANVNAKDAVTWVGVIASLYTHVSG